MTESQDNAEVTEAIRIKAAAAVATLNQCTHQLNVMGKDIKLSGYSWFYPGDKTSISVQGALEYEILKPDNG